MVQPVMDTLRLSEGLQGAGVERGQADGMAQALGTELDEHVVVRKEFDSAYDALRSEIALTRSNLEGEIALTRTNLEGEIALLRTEMNTKFNWGFGLVLAFLSVLVGLGLIDLNKPTPAPAGITYVPLVLPGATVAQPAPNAAVPVPRAATSAEREAAPPAPG